MTQFEQAYEIFMQIITKISGIGPCHSLGKNAMGDNTLFDSRPIKEFLFGTP